MADTTISGLSEGLPNKNSAIIPYSDGSTTYKTSPSGIIAASPGALLQVVQANYPAFQNSHTNLTFTDTGLNASITPKFSTSKILINISSSFAIRGPAGAIDGSYGFYNLTRNNQEINVWGAVQQLGWAPGSFLYLDSPNSTSLVTYKVQSKIGSAGWRIYLGWGDYETPVSSNITLQEIAG